MLAPYRHVASVINLTEKEAAELFRMTQRVMRRIDKALHPHGYNLGFNIGRAAGAGYDKHIHFHIVPRWEGDTNFMPVVGGQKVISESLDALRKTLMSVKI